MTAWVPGRGFVATHDAAISKGIAAVGRAKSRFYAGPYGQNAPAAQQQTGQQQPGQQPDPQQPDPQHPPGHRHPSTSSGGYILSEAQQATIGKPWKPYPELVGMSMGYDRSQYSFNNIEAMRGDGNRHRRKAGETNVNEGQTTEEAQDKTNADTGVFDMRPKAIGPGPQFAKLNAGYQPAGAVGSGPRVTATYTTTPRVTPMGAQSWEQPRGEIGMGQQPKTAAAAPRAGAAMGGLLRSRQNINNPEQGRTPASMAGRNVIDV